MITCRVEGKNGSGARFCQILCDSLMALIKMRGSAGIQGMRPCDRFCHIKKGKYPTVLQAEVPAILD